jgi:S-formylglutathione hydrolase FrmB
MSAHRTDRWQRLSFASDALRGNPLGDPHERTVWVWSPEDASRRYPSVYVIQGMTGMVDGWFNVTPWTESFPDAVERLAPQAVVVLVDAFTAVGGSQFLDSPAIGDYHTYLCDELVPFVDATFPTLADPRHRGIQGKSSGGYGAMVTPMLRPDLFGALATHAGDAAFELCYQAEFAPAARALREKYDGSYEAFWRDFRSGRPVLSDKDDIVLVNTYAMAAAYSADADGSIELPFDIATGELLPDVFARWLAWDPLRMARTQVGGAALRGLRGIWIDAGKHDEYFLDLGATAFRQALGEIGIADDVVHFELFAGTHGGITWRYPLALEWLVERLG